MSNWQPARPADLPTDQQNLLREVREALGDLDHDHDDRGPAVLAPGTDGHLRMILGPTGDDDSREVADKVAARLADAGLRLTADPERLAQGYAVKVARRGGRPEVGRPIMIRFPEELLARVDARAAAAGTNRAAAIRDLVTTALDQTERETAMTTFTIQIDATASADSGIWQSVHPAENVTDAGTAQDVAEWAAANQTVADGHWRVRVWHGADADTGSDPAAEITSWDWANA